ncbi:MAG: hypothetical protein M3O80_04320 [Chloroflexota bacterium]|nr:hypothetical protein [Chloroflexota bacterium]
MPIDHGAKVRTKDGHQAGHVKHAIWDLNGKKIAEYVIASGGLLGHDVIVSPELLESAARDGNQIVLNITKHELDELAHYESADYTTPPADWVAPTVSGFPAGGHLFPATEGETAQITETPPPTDEAGRESGVAGRERNT